MPYLKPKEITLTLMAGAAAPSPNRRSTSPRSLAVERLDVSMMYSARWRTGARTVRSCRTASSRVREVPARGCIRRVSLYRLMMVSTVASTKRIL